VAPAPCTLSNTLPNWLGVTSVSVKSNTIPWACEFFLAIAEIIRLGLAVLVISCLGF